MPMYVFVDRQAATGYLVADPAITVDSPAWFAWVATQRAVALSEAGVYDAEDLGTLQRDGGPAADQWVYVRRGRYPRQRALPIGATADLTMARILAAVARLIQIELAEDGALTRQG